MPPKSKPHKQVLSKISRIFRACQLFFWAGYTTVHNSWMTDKPIQGIGKLTRLIDSFNEVYVNESGRDIDNPTIAYIHILPKYPSESSYYFMAEFANKLSNVLSAKVWFARISLEWFCGEILVTEISKPSIDLGMRLEILVEEIKTVVKVLTDAKSGF